MERRYIARVVGVRPEIVETRTDYLVAVPRFRKVFMVTMNPTAEAAVGRATALTVIKKARAKDFPVFGEGRCIVYVFNDAWESETLIERAADVVAESQLSGLVMHLEPCSVFARALRSMWWWLRGLLVAKPKTAPETESAEVRPASAPAPAGSGMVVEQTSSEAELEDKVPV
jgi:hypothetical protein